MWLLFKCDSFHFKLLIFNRRLTTQSFSLRNKLSIFVLEIIQIVTIVTCENEISRYRALKFSISLKIFFFQDEFTRFIEFFITCETRRRDKRDKRNDKNFLQWCVVLNTTSFRIKIARFMIVVVLFFQMSQHELNRFDVSSCLFYFTLTDLVYLTTNQFMMYIWMKSLSQKQNSNKILNKINSLFFQCFQIRDQLN